MLKWLCGGQGIAFLDRRRDLVEKLELRVVGWFGTEEPFHFDRSGLALREDVWRFLETGTFAVPQAYTASGGMEIMLEVGVDAIRRRNQELTERVVELADDAGLEVRSPRDKNRRGGLVRVHIPGGEERGRGDAPIFRSSADGERPATSAARRFRSASPFPQRRSRRGQALRGAACAPLSSNFVVVGPRYARPSSQEND